MIRVFQRRNLLFVILFVFLQIQRCLLQTHWKNQKRNAEAGSADKKPSATVIFLHGLGDTGDRWATALATLKQQHVKIICPTARAIPVTVNHGSEMPAWFDIKGLDGTSVEDIDGIKNATRLVHSFIDAEIEAGIPSHRIVVGGFSQGGALALHAALTYPKKLAGVLALSCWLPLATLFTPAQVTANRNIRILQCHGYLDNVVPYGFGQLTAFILRRVTKNFEFKTYPALMHSVSPNELVDVGNFVRSYLPEERKTANWNHSFTR